MTDKKIVSTSMPTTEEDHVHSTVKKSKKLTLDTDLYKPAKTRAELYREMEALEEKVEEDIFDFASPIARGVALVIDMAFLYAVVIVTLELAPYEFAIFKHFLDLYKMQFIFATTTILKVLNVANVLFGLFLTWIVPLAFFNNSLGKKLLRIRVRGDDYYTISLTKAFQREVIFKPISMALIVGFIMPFVSKNKQSLHDKLASTLVIKD